MIILDGKKLSQKIKERIKQETQLLYEKLQKRPNLAVIIVGNNPASKTYVSMKEKACKFVGFESQVIRLPENTEEKNLIEEIEKLNKDENINGILVQLPLPKQINEEKIIFSISPEKDVDGFHPYNVGMLMIGAPTFIPCTPYGIIKILQEYNIKTEGKNVVVIGRSNIVGKPIASLLMQKKDYGNATVTICHSRTKNITQFTKSADILIAAIGRPNFVKADMIKEGAVVIDVGINRVEDKTSPKGYKLVGDVDYENAAPKTSAITPVPGGVGPMTIAMLLTNTLLSFKKKNNITGSNL